MTYWYRILITSTGEFLTNDWITDNFDQGVMVFSQMIMAAFQIT